jgi:hypothetical protein
MIVVVDACPFISTDIAELIAAFASHMVATLIFFNNKLAFLTLTIVQVVLKELDFMRIAFSLV